MKRHAFAIFLSLGLSTFAYASGSDPLPEPKPHGTPQASPESLYNRGLALANAGDFAGAEAAYRQALNLNGTLPEAWNGLGHALKKQKRFQEALGAYDQALHLRPDYPLAMQYLGELYVETGELDKARDLLRRLRSIDEKNAHKLATAILAGSTSW